MGRCMIVDGSSVIRKVAKRILADTQDRICEVATGAEALAAFAGEQPDVVLVDADLDDIDVVSFIRDLRSAQGGAEATIVVMLTEFNLVQMTKAKRAGADDYLLKPFDREQLMARFTTFAQAA